MAIFEEIRRNLETHRAWLRGNYGTDEEWDYLQGNEDALNNAIAIVEAVLRRNVNDQALGAL